MTNETASLHDFGDTLLSRMHALAERSTGADQDMFPNLSRHFQLNGIEVRACCLSFQLHAAALPCTATSLIRDLHTLSLCRAAGYETIMMNCNPETVSTDYDTSSRLYFEPLTVEDVLNVIEEERPDGIIVQFGGQTPLKLAGDLQAALTKFQIPAASGTLCKASPCPSSLFVLTV